MLGLVLEQKPPLPLPQDYINRQEGAVANRTKPTGCLGTPPGQRDSGFA
jgi:hypothetical protein